MVNLEHREKDSNWFKTPYANAVQTKRCRLEKDLVGKNAKEKLVPSISIVVSIDVPILLYFDVDFFLLGWWTRDVWDERLKFIIIPLNEWKQNESDKIEDIYTFLPSKTHSTEYIHISESVVVSREKWVCFRKVFFVDSFLI